MGSHRGVAWRLSIAVLAVTIFVPGVAAAEASSDGAWDPAGPGHQDLGNALIRIDPGANADPDRENTAPTTPTTSPGVVPPYRVTNFTIRTLAPADLPYAETRLPSKTPPAIHDADGIPMKIVDGKRYYGPAGLMQYGLRMQDAYRRSKDPEYLAIASKVLNKMMAIGVRYSGGVYLPYQFNFAMHGISTEIMRAPWYSAMAQGLALSLAVRLYRDTADPVFLSHAHLLFASFRRVGRGPNPWVTYIDGGRYLWLEEYPEPTTPSDHTANGFNFALFGLYDYYQETKDSRAVQILRAGLTTMRRFVGDFRVPGSYSKYCLRHGKPQAKYHIIVTWQLKFLYRMSGDSYFLSMSKLYYTDYH